MSSFDFTRAIGDYVEKKRDPMEWAVAKTAVPRREFARAVSAAGWKLLTGGDKFDPAGKRHVIVIGTVPWSAVDMAALGAFENRTVDTDLQIYVFDLDTCRTSNEVAALLPDVAPVLQTPALAEYNDGKLIAQVAGRDALAWLTGQRDASTNEFGNFE